MSDYLATMPLQLQDLYKLQDKNDIRYMKHEHKDQGSNNLPVTAKHLQCKNCDYKTKKADHMRKHYERKKAQSIQQCKICSFNGKNFSNEYSRSVIKLRTSNLQVVSSNPEGGRQKFI